ncbi:uncharacterized protein [Euwallacea similis]|uniref:uncharacterized protein isoform X1 n=1 Tax=Euwallacea similis TaxID=1736056 RepID=UPI00344E16F9
MTSISYFNLIIFLLSCVAIITVANPAIDKDMDDVKRIKYEEYIIEHEISATQARNVALCTDLNSINVPAGCQECTKEEKHYCTSSDLISDHCCCDRRYHAIYNNAIDPSPFGGNPLQSPYNTFLGLSNALGIRQPYSSAYTPFGNTFEGSSLGGSSFDGNSALKRRCPVCDSSVYGYCSEKLFHDSCCCHNPNNPYDKLPYQCQFADCSFLHANSCREHKLITACCCTNLYLYRK